ncbi:BAG family molecular chaperone regulator 2 [Vigna umbellata]|uniref:BAG family molecular chaperone regulator 2 n=1 Tax=Vigna umbellata TaxID=87088 RepID=UPI001F5EBC0D|nr:BAG family molecular chaperone regulator 2 [Vigna umbellata]
MMKLRSKRFSRSSSKLGNKGTASSPEKDAKNNGEIKWELRPGGMLVQKRESNNNQSSGEGVIAVRVSTVSQWHDISIDATSTFGELKLILSLVTNLDPREQRLLFKGKEREDSEFLHMVGVRDKDKVLMLEDPATKEMKLLGMARGQPINNTCCTIAV